MIRWARGPYLRVWQLLPEEPVHPEGFEPPTSRLSDERSNQMSYGCFTSTSVRASGLEPPASWSRTKRSTNLSYALLIFTFSQVDWIRTSDLLHPEQARYQASLRPDVALRVWVAGIEPATSRSQSERATAALHPDEKQRSVDWGVAPLAPRCRHGFEVRKGPSRRHQALHQPPPRDLSRGARSYRDAAHLVTPEGIEPSLPE